MLANSPRKEILWKWLSCCSQLLGYTCPPRAHAQGSRLPSQEASAATHSTEGHGQHRLHLGSLHRPNDPFLVKQGTACQGPELHVFDPNRHKLCV